MNISKLVLECIEGYQDTEPIFIKDIKKYVFEKSGKQNNVSVILNIIKNMMKGCEHILQNLKYQ